MVDEDTSLHDSVSALRTRFAGESSLETPLPRWTLPFAWCFAIGIWLVVLLVIFGPGLTAETAAQEVAQLPPERIAREPQAVQESPVEYMQGPTTAQGRPRTCSEAEARGQAPALEGEPGYAPWLDGDHDGISCERWGRYRTQSGQW